MNADQWGAIVFTTPLLLWWAIDSLIARRHAKSFEQAAQQNLRLVSR